MRPGEQATPRTSARLDEPATSKTSEVPNSRAELLEVLLRVDAEVKTMLPASLRRPPSRGSARQSERHDGPPSNTAEHLHPGNTSKRRICWIYHSWTHLRHLRARHGDDLRSAGIWMDVDDFFMSNPMDDFSD